MISEKTVELNLTTELINWGWWVTGRTQFAIGPTQRQEGVLGFDVAVAGPASGVLIQYKRAYVAGTTYTWHLNRTTLQDQHQRLQLLEASGHSVLYALPLFSTIAEVQAFRRRLLLRTAWFKPSTINPPGGPTGFHDVQFDAAAGKWTVSSPARVELPSPENVEAVIRGLERGSGRLEDLLGTANRILFENDQREVSLAAGDDRAPGVSVFAMSELAPAVLPAP